MAGPLVPNLPLQVLQLEVAVHGSHGREATGLLCQKGNVTFSPAVESLFLLKKQYS